MYGLVNEGLRELVIAKHGAAVWSEIAERAGVPSHRFISMQPYDDALSYALVGAAAEVLDVSAETLLEQFGEHWIRFTAERGYGSLIHFCGHDIGEFLDQLDSLHARVKLALPALHPPVISVTRLGPTSVRLHYASKRTGLVSLVIGLVRGLGPRFGVEVTVDHVVKASAGQPDELLVSWGAPA